MVISSRIRQLKLKIKKLFKKITKTQKRCKHHWSLWKHRDDIGENGQPDPWDFKECFRCEKLKLKPCKLINCRNLLSRGF